MSKKKLQYTPATVTKEIEYKNTMYPIGTEVEIADSSFCDCCVMVKFPDRVRPQGFYVKNRFMLKETKEKE
jgi:hypothetical protein